MGAHIQCNFKNSKYLCMLFCVEMGKNRISLEKLDIFLRISYIDRIW